MHQLADQIESIMPTAITGCVARTEGTTAAVAGFPAPVGALAEIERQVGAPIRGEVIGFRDQLTLVYPFSSIAGVRRGNRVRMVRTSRFLRAGKQLLGRVIDAHGDCVDGLPQPVMNDRCPLDRRPPEAIQRARIHQPLSTGIQAVDGLLTCGRGQRVGIFSGSGVGKSVLLGMMARHTDADVNVIALIGERGREVNEFIERDLDREGLAKSVVVIATSDQPALLRVHAAFAATSIAEYFRDQGKNVLFLMDSITRFAIAQREIGLAAGEPPTTRGYPPSVYSMLPKLVERAGTGQQGSITAMYSVLVEGDDLNEPVSDAVRGLLDGHIVLSRKLASQGHYPAIDVLDSLSRLMPNVVPDDQLDAATCFREMLSVYRDHEDLISIGAYRSGSNPRVDMAIAMRDELKSYLRQRTTESSTVESARAKLFQLAARCGTSLNTGETTVPNVPLSSAAPASGAKKKSIPA